MQKADFNKANGSSYIGIINTTYERLVQAFGEPHIHGGDKTTVEWILEFDDGTVATIYDWKEETTPEYEYDWHIGGFDILARIRVSEALQALDFEEDLAIA